jgi:uncharacterized coiled-coil protein SlyX
MELEARQRESEQVIDELRVDNKRLTEQRQLLYQGEENERAVGEKRDKEFSEARVSPSMFLPMISADSSSRSRARSKTCGLPT